MESDANAHEGAEKVLASRIAMLREEVSALLSEFPPDQIINLILLIDESIENYADAQGKEVDFGSCTGLDLLRGYYEDVADFVDSHIDSWDIPEMVDVLQLFAAYAVSCYSRADEMLASHCRRRDESTGYLIRAYDYCLEASQAMLFGYAEFKRTHKHLTDLEFLRKKALGIATRTSGGGKGRSQKYDPLRIEAYRLYDKLLRKREIDEWEAAGEIIHDLEEFASDTKWYEAGEKARRFPVRETVRNWLKRYRQRQNDSPLA